MPASARQLIAIKVDRKQTIFRASGRGGDGPADGRRRRRRRLQESRPPPGRHGSLHRHRIQLTPTPQREPSSNCTSPMPQKFVPARFEDFVWFSDAELRQRIQQHAPLFDGELPLYGRLADEVSDVLQAMLVERSIPGHVEYRARRQTGRARRVDQLPCERCSHSSPQHRVHRSRPCRFARARSCRPQASRPRILAHSPQSARPASASSGLLRAWLPEGGSSASLKQKS